MANTSNAEAVPESIILDQELMRTGSEPPRFLRGFIAGMIKYNSRISRRFEAKTVDLVRYAKKIGRFAKLAGQLAFKDLRKKETKMNKKLITKKKVDVLDTTSRTNACANCNLACAAASTACKFGCIAAGPGAPACELGWALTALGCVGDCALIFCQ